MSPSGLWSKFTAGDDAGSICPSASEITQHFSSLLGDRAHNPLANLDNETCVMGVCHAFNLTSDPLASVHDILRSRRTTAMAAGLNDNVEINTAEML